MTEPMDEQAVMFFERLAAEAGTPALQADESAAILDLARDVAHGSERRFAPLAAYAAGLAIGAATAPGDRAIAVAGIIEAVHRLDSGGG